MPHKGQSRNYRSTARHPKPSAKAASSGKSRGIGKQVSALARAEGRTGGIGKQVREMAPGRSGLIGIPERPPTFKKPRAFAKGGSVRRGRR